MSKRNGKNITVLCTSNQAIISVAKSLLDEAGIKYIVTTDGTHDSNTTENNGNAEFELQVELAKSLEARNVIADLVELDFDDQ